MDGMVEAIVREASTTLHPELEGFTRDPYPRQANTNPDVYVGVLIYDIQGLAQGPTHQRLQLWRTSFHALCKVFRPCDSGDSDKQKEVLSMKCCLDSHFTLG